MALHDWLNWGLQIWLALMLATVVVKMLQGDIALTDAMSHEHQGDYAPERAQLFLASIAPLPTTPSRAFRCWGPVQQACLTWTTRWSPYLPAVMASIFSENTLMPTGA